MNVRKSDSFGYFITAIYFIGQFGTFGYLTFFDDVSYTWWNWILILPLNGVLASLWPVYWAVIVPVQHYVL